MAVKFLKPMLDAGSSRVFNFNSITQVIKEKDANALLFFRNPPLNSAVLIKDTVPDAERKGLGSKPIGTKLYFPYNEEDVYEGGKTIFLHAKNLQQAIIENVGLKASLTQDLLAEDVKILQILDDLPSLDPFLMKDIFARANLKVNEAYFEISQELWQEIETFVMQRFEPLVRAAFPDSNPATDERARTLVQKIWEARDAQALAPLIQAFRLPGDRALEIFAAWKGINYYSFQYKRGLEQLGELSLWFKGVEIPVGTMQNAERATLKAQIDEAFTQLREDWKEVETILNQYSDGYDKMFKHKISSAPFLEFLHNCNKSYWELGNRLGRLSHASYCWNALTERYPRHKMPWNETQATLKLLSEILKVEKKAATSVSW